MNIYEAAKSQKSSYIGSINDWEKVWESLADLFDISLKEVSPLFNAEQWLNELKKYAPGSIPSSLSDFVYSNGINIIQEIIFSLDDLWARNLPTFFCEHPHIVMSVEFDDNYWGVNSYISDKLEFLSDDESDYNIFFDFEDWVNVSDLPVQYFKVIKESLAFAENILGNGELFWMSPTLKYSDGEWDLLGYYPSDCEFVRFKNTAALIFYVLRGLISNTHYSEHLSAIKEIFNKYLISDCT